MASHLPIFILILIFFAAAPTAHTQDSGSVTVSDMECGPRLLPLVPCAPFVQGSMTSPSPGDLCCDSLIDIYDKHPECLCLLLNDPLFISFPINQTRALQLPFLCKLALNIATCSEGSNFMTPESPFAQGAEANASAEADLATPEPPQSPIQIEARTNTSSAVSPFLALPPAPKTGLGFSRSASTELKIEGYPMVGALMTSILLGVARWV